MPEWRNGRRSRLKPGGRKAWGFESLLRHHPLVDRYDYLAMACGLRRAHDACMELLIGLAMTLGYAIVVGGFLVLIAGLTGGLGPDGADEGLHRRDR